MMTIVAGAVGWALAVTFAASWLAERRRNRGLLRAIEAQDARWRNATRPKPWDLEGGPK